MHELRQAHALLRAGRAATAERLLRDLSARQPGDLNCLWLLGAAALEQNRLEESISRLESVLARAPEFASARIDLARAYRRSGRAHDAREQVRRVLEKSPHHSLAWLAYGDVLVDLGQFGDARVAFERALLTDPFKPRVAAATAAMEADDRKAAEEAFRAILQEDPSHVAALCGLAALSLLADVPQDAERLLRHALRQAQHLPLAWRGLAPTLSTLGRIEEAAAGAKYLIKIEPENPQSWIVLAGIATRLLRQEEALAAYERAAQLKPQEVRLQMSIGHVLKTLGRRSESEAAYKAAIAMQPDLGEAYWSLADLKNYHFSDAEVAQMQEQLGRAGIARSDEAQFLFALGKALEQRHQYPDAFAAYARGNAIRRLDAPFDIAQFEQRCDRIRSAFDAEFFATVRGSGNPSRAPIFIVGLPRSGSTLIEQILASHSRIEGTMELPHILNFVREFDDLVPSRDGYPQTVRSVAVERFEQLGSRYLHETAPLRSGKEHFTDKLPNNFSHIGLIRAILPRAILIDARRHPMDACFSTFKQHFAEGQTFSYDLDDLGRYYRCYLSLMDHWDEVLPGAVLRVQYEELVRDPDTQIRRLLDHCGVEFETACLSFHETKRSVRTASAEQVRRPIYTSGVAYWKHFETQLEPLRRSLGDCLSRFEHLG